MKNIKHKIALYGGNEQIGAMCFVYVIRKLSRVFTFNEYYKNFVRADLWKFTLK